VGNGKAAPAATAEKSIAVLAFENVGGDRENEVFATGVPEEILMQLGRVAGLRLAGANSSFLLRGRPDAEVAQKLNVTHVVSGSVQRVGSQVKITARLVNAADGTQLWSDRFSEEMRNIFAAQEKIAGLIAEKLSLRLGGSSRAAKAIDPDAQRLVLEGRYHWNLRTFESFGRAEEAFRKAIALAPEFAEAHAGLAGVCMSRSNFSALEGLVPLAEDMPTARREAALALQLDPNLAEAHAALGMTHYLERDYALAEKSYQSALAANPQLALARMWYGLLLAGMGRFEPAEAQSRKGAELEPLWFMQFQIWGNICQHQGNFSRAAELLARAAALRSELYVSNLGSRVTVEYRLGHTESAVNLARQVRANFDVRPRGSAAPQAIYVLLKTGHAAEAEDYARQVMARLAPQSHLRGYVLVALGRIEEAWPYLSDMPTQELLKIARDPMFEPVRRDPRFSALAATLRIPQELLSSR
jgi:TolB-like protein/Tfp pilus assembly protein PilF